MVNDILVLVPMGAVAALLLYLFWPGPNPCKKCESELDVYGYCTDLTCPYSDYQQHETYTEG